MTRRWMFLAVTGSALLGGWYLFRPELLWVDSVVAESLEEAAAPGAVDAAADMPVALAQGSFHGVSHDGAGSATVYRMADGRRILRFTEFATSNGPDLYVYLVASPDVADNDAVERAGYVSLGRLKGNRGDQNYLIPQDADLSRYRTVSIWCKRFGVNFAEATFSDV